MTFSKSLLVGLSACTLAFSCLAATQEINGIKIPDTATVSLRWSWPVASDEWSYTTDAVLTKIDDTWQATWSRDLIEPSLKKATVLDVTPIGGARGPIVGADG